MKSVSTFFCVGVVVCFSSLASCAEPASVICDSAVPYRGDKLHAPISEDVWAALAGDLDGTLDQGLTAKLDDVVEELLKKSKSPGITVAVGIPGKGIWSKTSGLRSMLPRRSADEETLFYWCSVGKAFTATVVLQLIEEKKLSFDDRLSRWFPDFPNANVVTVEHLLTHTSGIYSFQEDPKFRERKGYSPPSLLIDVARGHGCQFCPGELWSYSNTGYVLLGRIIEEMEEKPYHQVVQSRIIEPLKLEHTVAFAPKDPPKSLAVGQGNWGPMRGFDVTTPFAAGSIGASAEDMVRFWNAYLTGKLLPMESVRASFVTLYPMFGNAAMCYGRGVMVYDVPEPSGKMLWLGHSGGTPFHKAVVAYDATDNVYVAVALNKDAPAEACANKLIQVVKEHVLASGKRNKVR